MTPADPHFPLLHRVHRRGWINDPNGIIRIDGRWHVFFQFNPHAPRHERIHWGHVSSADLVTWREEPLGPVPRAGEADAGGCWSGVAAIQDGAPHLVHSGVDGTDDAFSRVIVQRMTADLSAPDGPAVVAADLPAIDGLAGVRDPFLLELDGRRLAIQGAELRRATPSGDTEHVPVILAWDRTDLQEWRFLGPVLRGDGSLAREHAPAHLWECPQLVPLRDEATGQERWVLTLGRWEGPTADGRADAALNGVGYLVGTLTWDDAAPVGGSTGALGPLRFTPQAGGSVDHGPDFYAPQAYLDAEGERVLLWGWSWESARRTAEQTDAQGWAGCLTFPRELVLRDGTLSARVPAELRALRGMPLDAADGQVVLAYPARAEIRAKGPVRIEVLGADGTVRASVMDTAADGQAADAEAAGGSPVTVLLDASILEVIPEHGVPRTVRLTPQHGDSVRVVGRITGAWELRAPLSGGR